MQTNATIERTGSPVPEVIAEPVSAHDDTAAVHQRLGATQAASRTTQPASSPGPRNPASIVLARLLSVIRGDKYMANAYEPAWSALMAGRAAATVVRPNNNGEAAARVQSAAASQPSTAERAATAQTKER
jgi:hypothetical protein